MATSEEHFALYTTLRNTILARHFAIGRWHRCNLLSLRNHLAPLPAALSSLSASERELLHRWHVHDHERENPLMLTAHLHTMLAVETLFGSPTAVAALGRSLDTVAALVPASGPAAGYITRWDPVGSDHWLLDGQGMPVRCVDFLIDDAGRYQTCAPTTDPRHVTRRTRETLLALRARRDADRIRDERNNGVFWGYVNRRRRWETSADELSGLFGGWAVVDRLVPAMRPRVRVPARAVIRRLADNGWTQIRPCGGLAGRGASGVLQAFELPVDRWARSIGIVGGASSGLPFDAALSRAGYGPVLDGPIAGHRALAWAGTLVLGPFLATLGGAAAILGGLITGTGIVVGPATLGLMSALAAHADVFDVMNDGESMEPVIAALLNGLEPGLRWWAYLKFVGAVTRADLPAVNFPPLLALMSLDDPAATAGREYVGMLRARRANIPLAGMPSFGLDTAMATAVAVLLGADELLPTLIRQLDERHDFFIAAGRDLPVVEGEDGAMQDIVLAMDYLAALALAWLHGQRTPGVPAAVQPPGQQKWQAMPEPVVPALVLRHFDATRRAARAPFPAPTADWPLFSGAGDSARDGAPVANVVPPVPSGPPWEYTFLVGRWMGDVPTGIELQDGHDFQFEATGTVDGVGPQGRDPCDDARWPLHRGMDPQARQGALLAHLGGYFHVGDATPRRRFLTWEPMPLHLRINRAQRNSGSNESFEVSVRVWGPKPATAPPGFIVEFVRWEYGDTARRKNVRLRISDIGGTHGNGDRWSISVADAAALILDYGWRFRVKTAVGPLLAVGGRRTGRRYLRTVGDRSRTNNLKQLPEE